MEFTINKLAKEVAEKTLDEILYDDKSIREWMQIIASEDCISREDAINVVHNYFMKYLELNDDICLDGIRSLSPVTPKTEWIPIKIRPMTEEEKEHFFEYADSRYDDTYTILDCPLPDDGQEVILSVNGYVCTDIFCRDSADGCYFETYDIDDVEAWMPLPQPYKVESEDAK